MSRLRVYEPGKGWCTYSHHPGPWHIRIQRRCEYNGRYPRDDWRAYREWLVWPITFKTEAEGTAFMEQCFTFSGLHGRKMSASVCRCNPKPTKAHKGSPHGN